MHMKKTCNEEAEAGAGEQGQVMMVISSKAVMYIGLKLEEKYDNIPSKNTHATLML